MSEKTTRFNLVISYLSKWNGQITLFLQKPSVKKWGRSIISIGWIALIGFILWGGWKFRQEIIPYLLKARINYLLAAILSFFPVFISAIVGWMMVMNRFITGIKPWTHIYIYCATIASRRIPGTVWYIGGRLPLYQRWGVSPVKTSIASTIELILILVSGCITSLITLPFGLRLPDVIIALLILGGVIGLATLHPHVLSKLLLTLHHPIDQDLTLWQALAWLIPYIAAWITGGVTIYFITDAFYPLRLENLLFIIGAWSAAGVAGFLTFFLPSSFGVTDITITFFLTTLVPLPIAAVIAIINRLLSSLFEVILSAFFFFFLKDLQPKPESSGI